MSRGPVIVRDVEEDDAEALEAIWRDFTAGPHRPNRPDASVDQIKRAIHRLRTEPTERLLVAVVDDAPVGVAHLRRAPWSPIHDDEAVHVGYLHVLSAHRRRGIGRQLMDSAAEWAEELESMHIVASVAATARDANRFLARLGLGQVAVVRACTVAHLRSKLPAAGVKSAAGNAVAVRRLVRSSRRKPWQTPVVTASSRFGRSHRPSASPPGCT
jgi:GNAT superfamily N-acetyltransferase